MQSLLAAQTEAAEAEWLHLWKLGPRRVRWDRVPLQVGDAAPDFALQSADGAPLQLSSLWQDRPALLLFWRHFGCSCGVDRARRLRDEYTELQALGVNVVVITQGEPERAAAYRQRHALLCLVACDPRREVYAAYDLLEGRPSQIVFDAPDAFLRQDVQAGADLQASRHGTDRAAVDSPWQLPGEFVVDRRGAVRLAYRYQYCEDWPNPMVLVAALKEALREG